MFKLSISLILLTMVYYPIKSFAAAVQLPATGQTSCYNATGALISCTDAAAKGQDGQKQPGVAYPQPRFIDNNNGTITDNLTGLAWKPCNSQMQNVSDAMAVASSLNICAGNGSDAGQWRVPNRLELVSLVNFNNADNLVWLKSQGLNLGINQSYCTSTSGFTVNLAKGYISRAYYYCYLLAVRD